jgi:hypothetical protein
MTLPLSVLDLAPVPSGGSSAESVRRTVELARLAERLGYVRHWFAEHHGMPSVASSAPEVLIAHVAAHTRTLRVGSGGVMLPNHAPLRVAVAFRTLSALYPDRIDLGLGRAPGPDGPSYYIVDRNRSDSLWLLVGVFVVMALLVGRLQGASAIHGLAASMLVILRFIIPGILSGHDPRAIALIGAMVIMCTTLLLAMTKRLHPLWMLAAAAGLGALGLV